MLAKVYRVGFGECWIVEEVEVADLAELVKMFSVLEEKYGSEFYFDGEDFMEKE